MIRLAKLVAGRMDQAREGDAPDNETRRQKDRSNYGISRLGLAVNEGDRNEPLRPSFGDDVERGLEPPAPPAPTRSRETAPGDSTHSPPAPKPEMPAGKAPLPPEQLETSYKKTSVKMPRHMSARLKAYARATGCYQYSVMTEAVERFLDEAVESLSPGAREKMDELIERFQHEESRSRWREIFTLRWK